MDWLAQAVALVAPFEGCERRGKDGMIRPYLDKLARPPVWTRGYGRTYGISADSPAISHDEARKELASGLTSYDVRCVVLAPALADKPACRAAVCSWAWNCGIGAFRVSRLRRAINEQRWLDAIELMKKPNTAGGVVYRGLQRRRLAESACFAAGVRA